MDREGGIRDCCHPLERRGFGSVSLLNDGMVGFKSGLFADM